MRTGTVLVISTCSGLSPGSSYHFKIIALDPVWNASVAATTTASTTIAPGGQAPFGFADNIYTSAFFMATGFHGFHVIVGTIFLTVCLLRARVGHFTPRQHFGFEAAAWYWHFVDVVWLFLFVSIYIWGSWGGHVHGA